MPDAITSEVAKEATKSGIVQSLGAIFPSPEVIYSAGI